MSRPTGPARTLASERPGHAPRPAENHTLSQQALHTIPIALPLIVGHQLLQPTARGLHAAVGDVLAELGIRRPHGQDGNRTHGDEDNQGKSQDQLCP